MAEKLNIQEIKSNLKNPKFEVDFATPNNDYAIFLPSISSLYAKHVSKDESTVRNGNIPQGMRGMGDLNFLDPEQGLYWYPWALYSAGHAQLDLTKTDIQESMIQKRDRKKTFILADSGGYQLSTGVLKGELGDPYDLEENPKSLRHKIMKWMEHTADFSMILDIPTTSCHNQKSFIYKKRFLDIQHNQKEIDRLKALVNASGDVDLIKKFNSLLSSDPRSLDFEFSNLSSVSFIEPNQQDMFNDCLNYTIKNCEYFIKHRTPGATKFLNVLQGRNMTEDRTGEGDIWWEKVKHFNDKSIYGDRAFEGWAIPGNLKFDFQMLFKRLKIMYEEGFLNDTGDHLLIHFLGISRISAGLLYTTLQRELRRNINPNIIITYDAASPFVCTAKGKGYTEYTINNEKMAYKMDPLPDKGTHYNGKLINNNDPWVQDYTVLGSKLKIGDIRIKAEQGKSSTWDGTSYVFIMNMNVERHIKAIQEAHLYYDGPKSLQDERIPARILAGKIAIEEIVRNKFSQESMDKYLSYLDNVLGMNPNEPDAIDNIEGFEIEVNKAKIIDDGATPLFNKKSNELDNKKTEFDSLFELQ